MIAVGSGEFLGQGLGKGSQAKFNFLPERHTDFAFSVWAEEHGFIGCFLLIFLFTVLITQIFHIAERTKDPFSACVTVGIGAFFIFHFLINIAMVVGIFPVAGVPLTFISYGGTHMITALSCIGILVSIERKRYFAASHI
jgi:rod shape determining protein RodA